MSYYPIAATSDDRSSRGAVPLRRRNMKMERTAIGSVKGAGYFLSPSPGFVSRVVPFSGAMVRGVFCRPGVVNGGLFVVAGTTLYSVSSSWAATALGTISGYTNVLMDGLRNVLVIVADGYVWTWNGTTLTKATDTDLSADLYTLAVLGQRAITSPQLTDQLEWSAVLDALDWPADGYATSEIQPDPIEANVVVGDELYSLGRISTQIWRAVGGDDSSAFDTFAGAIINKGCIARDTAQRVDAALFWLADDRCLYRTAGVQAQRIVNRDIETALLAMTDAEVASCQAWTYADGSKTFYVLRPPVGGRAWAFDVAEESWGELTTWQADEYRFGFYAYAHDKHVVAGPQSDRIYTMEPDIYADAGAVIEREFMVHIPAPNDARIDSIKLDIKPYGQPLSGQGSDPEIMLTFYRDGGNVESTAIGIEKRIKLGMNGVWNKRPIARRFGQIGSDGFLLRCRITDPIGFSVHGVWVNED